MSDHLHTDNSHSARRGSLHDLEVLVVGIEDMISREVVRSLVEAGAAVTAAAGDEPSLAHLQRDLGLYRTTVKIAQIDLFSASEMVLFADNLRGQQKLPHIVICCRARPPFPTPHVLSFLQPSLVLQAIPRPGAWFSRAVAGLNTPSLAMLLKRSQRPGLFDPKTSPQRVLIAGHLFTLCRWNSSPTPGPVRRRTSNANLASSSVEAAS